MKLYTFILVKIIVVTMSRGIEISPELQKIILKFGYSINYKYEGMLAHSFDRFYIVTKFMLPSMGDIKFSKLNFDHTCMYMNKEYAPNMDSRKYLTELKTYCNNIYMTSLEQETFWIRETSFHQLSNMASSGLKKMLSQQF